MIESIGWIGFVFIMLGYYLNAKQNIKCFFIWGLGNILYLIYALLISAPPQVAISLFVLGMNIYGYLIWSNNDGE
tara:strand:+ start:93 stop:317 length:225 start_codon:yes stop_codon:yes gene_type:complete